MVDGDNAFHNLAKLRRYKSLPVARQDRQNSISLRLQGISRDSKKEVAFTVFIRKQFRPSKYSDNWIWVEFKKNKTSSGWIYGKANFVAIETTKEFVIVSSKIFLHWLNTSHKLRYDLPFVREARDAHYKILKDVHGRESTQVNIRDIKKLEGVQIWNKE